MKRIRLGEFTSKLWPVSKLYIGLYDQSSKHWLFFTPQSNKLALITSQKFASKNVKWSIDCLINDSIYAQLWDYLLAQLHMSCSESELYKYLQINLKKDPKLTHLHDIADVAALRSYYASNVA